MSRPTVVISSGKPGRDEVVPGVHDLGRALEREEQRARVELRCGEQLELERRDDAVVAATAAHGPEQVGLVVVVDAAQLAVGGHDLDGREGVGLEAVLAREPAHAAAERVAGHAHVTRGARERREPGGGGAVGHGRPAHARAHAGAARGDVDADLLEVVGPDEQRVLEALDRPGVVPRGLGGDAQAVLGRVAHRLGYVRGARDADHGCRLLVVGQVEGLARRVPRIVAGHQDLAVDAGLELGEAAALGDQHGVPSVVGHERVDGPDQAEPAGKAVIAAVSVVATAAEFPVEDLQVEAQVQLPALHCEQHRPSRARSHRGDPYTYPLTFRGRPLRGGQRGGQLASGRDVQLPVRVGEVNLDRFRRHVERLGDVAVGLTVCRERRHAQLALGERLDPVERRGARPRAGGVQLGAHVLGKGARA